jgi:hypothetical protein
MPPFLGDVKLNNKMANNNPDSKPASAPPLSDAQSGVQLGAQEIIERERDLLQKSRAFRQLHAIHRVFTFAGIEGFFEEDPASEQQFERYTGPSPFSAAILYNKQEIHLGAVRILLEKIISGVINYSALDALFKEEEIKNMARNWLNLTGVYFPHDANMGRAIVDGLEKAGILTIEQMWQAAGSDFYYFLEVHYPDKKPDDISYNEIRIGDSSHPHTHIGTKEACKDPSAKFQDPGNLAPPASAPEITIEDDNKTTVPRVSEEISQAARLAAQAAQNPPEQSPDSQPPESSEGSTAYFKALAEGDKKRITLLTPFNADGAPPRISVPPPPAGQESAEESKHLDVPTIKVKFYSGKEITVPLIGLRRDRRYFIGAENHYHGLVEDRRLNAEIEFGPTGMHVRILQGGVALHAVGQNQTILNDWRKVENGEPLSLARQGFDSFTDTEIEEIRILESERIETENLGHIYTARLQRQVETWADTLLECSPEDQRITICAGIIDEFTKRAEENGFLHAIDREIIAAVIKSKLEQRIKEWGQCIAERAQNTDISIAARKAVDSPESKRLQKIITAMHEFAAQRTIPIGDADEIKQLIAEAAEPYNQRVQELKAQEDAEARRKQEALESSDAAMRRRKNERFEKAAAEFEDVHWDESDPEDRYNHLEKGSVIIVEKIGHGESMRGQGLAAQSIRPKALRPPVNTRSPNRQIFPVLLRRYTGGTHPSNTIELPQILHGKRTTRAFMFEIIYEPVDRRFKLKWLGGYLDMKTSREVMLEEECELSEFREEETDGQKVRLNIEICGYNLRIETNHGFTHKFLERESERLAGELIQIIEDQNFTSAEMDRDAVDGIRRLIDLGYIERIVWEGKLKRAISGLWGSVNAWRQDTPLADSSYIETLHLIGGDENVGRLKEAAQKRLKCYASAHRESVRESAIEREIVKLPHPWQLAYYSPRNCFWSKRSMQAYANKKQAEADRQYDDRIAAEQATQTRYCLVAEKGIVEIAKFAQMGLLRESDIEDELQDLAPYEARVFKIRQLRTLFAQFERGVDPVPAAASFLSVGAGRVMSEVFTEDERNVFNRRHIDVDLDGNAPVKEFLRKRVIILAKNLLKKARAENDYNALGQLEGLLALRDDEGNPLFVPEELILQDLRDVNEIGPEIERLKTERDEARRVAEEQKKAEAAVKEAEAQAEIDITQAERDAQIAAAEADAAKQRQQLELQKRGHEAAQAAMTQEFERRTALIEKARGVIDVIQEVRSDVCNLSRLLAVSEDFASQEIAAQMSAITLSHEGRTFSWENVRQNYRSLAIDKGRELALYAVDGVKAAEYIETIRDAVKRGVFGLKDLGLGEDLGARLQQGIEKERTERDNIRKFEDQYRTQVAELNTTWYDRRYLGIIKENFTSDQEASIAGQMVRGRAVYVLGEALNAIRSGRKIYKARRAIKALAEENFPFKEHFSGEDLDLLQQVAKGES